MLVIMWQGDSIVVSHVTSHIGFPRGKHLDELDILLNYNCIDSLAINETRLDGSISDQDVKVEGYDMIRCDRTVHGRLGWGCLLLCSFEHKLRCPRGFGQSSPGNLIH